jgi:hypothetical protein
VKIHEDPRNFFRLERRASNVPAGERRAIPAREGAGIGLHDAHEPSRPAPGHANSPKPNRIVTATKHGASTGPVFPINPSFLSEQFKPPAKVHGEY